MHITWTQKCSEELVVKLMHWFIILSELSIIFSFGYVFLYQWFSKWGSRPSSINITWELVRNANPHAQPRPSATETLGIGPSNLCLTCISGVSDTKFENCSTLIILTTNLFGLQSVMIKHKYQKNSKKSYDVALSANQKLFPQENWQSLIKMCEVIRQVLLWGLCKLDTAELCHKTIEKWPSQSTGPIGQNWSLRPMGSTYYTNF